MKGLFGLSLLPLLAAGSPIINVDTIHNDAAPVISSSNAKEIPNSYMVVFKKHVTERDATVHHNWVQDIHLTREGTKQELRKRSQSTLSGDETIFEGLRHTYNIPGGLLGYAGHFDEDVIELVRRHPDVSQSAQITLFHPDKHFSFLLCEISDLTIPPCILDSPNLSPSSLSHAFAPGHVRSPAS